MKKSVYRVSKVNYIRKCVISTKTVENALKKGKQKFETMKGWDCMPEF